MQMGMYTEIFVNTDLKTNTPYEVINTIKAMCARDSDSEYLADKPERWSYLFNDGSCYTPQTSAGQLFKHAYGDHVQYSLIAKGDIKNYNDEIEDFFEFIKPWCSSNFIGYHRYEEDNEPTLVYSS